MPKTYTQLLAAFQQPLLEPSQLLGSSQLKLLRTSQCPLLLASQPYYKPIAIHRSVLVPVPLNILTTAPSCIPVATSHSTLPAGPAFEPKTPRVSTANETNPLSVYEPILRHSLTRHYPLSEGGTVIPIFLLSLLCLSSPT